MNKKICVALFGIFILMFCLQLTALADSSDDISDVSAVSQTSGTDKVFQTTSVVIMTIGILGLPAYFLLNSRKKRLLREYEEANNKQNGEDEPNADED